MGSKQRKRKAALRDRETAVKASSNVVGADPGPAFSGTTLLLSLLLVAAVAVVYAQVRHFEFVYLDDPVYVAENTRVLQGLSWEGLRWALTTQAAGNWHPLTWVSHMGDIEMYGPMPGGHHVTSVVLHILNTVLLFAAMFRMTRSTGKSAFVAALFALHPQHVESVAWISERKDVLSTLFWMLTIHAYISYARKRSVSRMALVIVFFALGLMSKPMLVTVPFTLLLLDYWPLKRVSAGDIGKASTWYPLIVEKIPLFVLTIFSMIVTVKVQRGYGAVVALNQLPPAARVANSLVAYVAYMRDLIWPAKLAAFYPFHAPSAGLVGAAVSILVLFTVLAVKNVRKRPYLPVGWAWYVGTLIPAIGLVQVGDQGRADRYTYVPVIGLLIIIAWGTSELLSRFKRSVPVLWVLGISITAACAIVSLRQVSYWQNNLKLFTRAVAVTTGNYRAHALLGVALSAKERYPEAVAQYRAALAIAPGNSEARSNLGATLVALGKTDEALEEFAEAVRYKPNTALYHYNYGVMLSDKGRAAEAIAELRTAVQLDPNNKAFAAGLSVATAKEKR